MQKRGQVTVFIILGILMLGVAIALIYLRPAPAPAVSAPQARELQSRYEACLKDSVADTLQLMGAEGGQAVVLFSADGLELPVADWLSKGKMQIPPLHQMEAVLEDQAANDATSCMRKLQNETGLQYVGAAPDVSAAISQDRVLASVGSPGMLRAPGFSYTIHDANIDVDVRLGYLRDIAEEVVSNFQRNNGDVDYYALMDFDVRIKIIPQQDYRYVQIYDYVKPIRGQPFILAFGVVP